MKLIFVLRRKLMLRTPALSKRNALVLDESEKFFLSKENRNETALGQVRRNGRTSSYSNE